MIGKSFRTSAGDHTVACGIDEFFLTGISLKSDRTARVIRDADIHYRLVTEAVKDVHLGLAGIIGGQNEISRLPIELGCDNVFVKDMDLVHRKAPARIRDCHGSFRLCIDNFFGLGRGRYIRARRDLFSAVLSAAGKEKSKKNESYEYRFFHINSW